MLKTYSQDGRWPIEKLYQSFSGLEKKFGWRVEKIYEQKVGKALLPILGLRTRKEGKSLWLIAGIHGEEPAGPVALAQNVEFLGKLGQKMPIVLLPLCNPSGYLRDWRYPNEYRNEKKGKSVSDSGHLLPDLKSPTKPRTKKPACHEAKALTFWVIKISKKYYPQLVIDFHEDEDKKDESFYIYFLGEQGADDQVAREVVKILLDHGFSIQMHGKTRFGEKIKNGIVANISDGSIDELLAAKKIIFKDKVVPGPSAERVVTIETSTVGVPLEKRVKAHSEILCSVEKFFPLKRFAIANRI
jgi:predicted deacylase